MKPKPPKKISQQSLPKSSSNAKDLPKKTNKWYLLAALVAIFVALLWYNSARDDNNTQSPSANQSHLAAEVTAAQKLASLDANAKEPLDVNDKNVLQVNTLLNSLSTTYHESTEDIANATYVAHQQFIRSNAPETNYRILEHMNSTPPTEGVKYKQAVIAYALAGGK